MVKKYKFLMLGITAAAMLAGCGKADSTADKAVTTEAGSKTETVTEADTDAAAKAGTAANADTEADADATSEADTESADTDEAADAADLTEEDGSDAAEEAQALDPITPSEYLVKNASDYVTLTSYDGLEAIQYTYDISDDMVQEQIQAALEDAGTEETVDTPSEAGDTVYLNLKSTVQGDSSDSEEEETYFTLGNEEYGAEFDQQLTGLSVGDTKKFSISFDDEIWIDTWMDQTVDFEAEITDVTKLSIPEYDDDFLADYTDYKTKEEYEAALRTSLEEEYAQTSYYDAVDELFRSAIDQTEFDGYPQELFDSCKESMISSYSMFAGDEDTDVNDILAAFGITDEDLDAETQDQVNRRLFISAYCEANDIEVTEEEYTSYVAETATYYGVANPTDFEEIYTRDALVWSLYESKVGDQLYQAAKITQMDYSDELLTDDDFALDGTSEDTEDILEIETGADNETETETTDEA